MLIIFDSYLGETMLKIDLAKKYKWKRDNSSDIPLLVNNDGDFITPIDKIYKRLINGKIDSILSFYKFVMSYI